MAKLIRGSKGRLALFFTWEGKDYRPSVERGVKFSRDICRKPEYVSLERRVTFAIAEGTFKLEDFFADSQITKKARWAEMRAKPKEPPFALWTYAENWLRTRTDLKAKGLRAVTYYLTAFLKGKPLGAMDVRIITSKDIQAAIESKFPNLAVNPDAAIRLVDTERDRHGAVLVTKFLHQLRIIFDLLVDEGHIAKNPARKVKNPAKGKREIINPVPLDERIRLFAAATNQRDRVMLIVGFGLGPRVQELADIHHVDIHYEDKVIDIRGTKTEGAERPMDLPPSVAEALRSMPVPLDKGHIFRGHGVPYVNMESWRKRNWKPLFDKAGIEYRPPTVMRHTFAVELLAAGKDPVYVARQMGDDPDTMFKHYARFVKRYRNRIKAAAGEQ